MIISKYEQTIYIGRNDTDTAKLLCARLIELTKPLKNEINIAFPGGKTPAVLFDCLANSKDQDLKKFSSINVFQTDERFVDSNSGEKNFNAIKKHFLSKTNLKNITAYEIQTSNSTPNESASEYESTIRKYCSTRNGIPQIDILVLGVGEDGHIASLFPNVTIPNINSKLYVETYVPQLDSWRITLTHRLINNSNKIIIFATGTNKSNIINTAIHRSNPGLPIDTVIDQNKNIEWFLDETAASILLKQ